LKDRHFGKIEVMEAEWQAMLNILTEHGFQDALQNGRRARSSEHARKGTTWRVMVPVSPELVFDEIFCCC
jgi:hypothetical protein